MLLVSPSPRRRGGWGVRSPRSPLPALLQQSVRLRRPPEHPLRLREVVLLLRLVASDEEGVEAAVPVLDRFQRREVRRRQVFLIGHKQRLPDLRDAWVPSLVQKLLAGARAGDPQ